MEVILASKQLLRGFILFVVVAITSLIVGLFKLIFGSYILGFIFYFGLIYILLREVGTYVMYPGSSFYTISDIEMRIGKEVANRISQFINVIRFVTHCIEIKTFKVTSGGIDMKSIVNTHIMKMTEMLAMYQSSLSPRKKEILMIYRQVQNILLTERQNEVSILDIIGKTRIIQTLTPDQLKYFGERLHVIEIHLRRLGTILQSYAPPTKTFDLLKYRMSSEKLFEIRFGLHNWNTVYEYEKHKILTQDGNSLESVIIHDKIDLKDKRKAKNGMTVLFCNPNGVFLQFFGLENQYVHNYLREGFNVILWNYRGYGQSTGNPSISKSQNDACDVYNHYKHAGYRITLVHGYSIGGAAAVGLASKHCQQAENREIEILIVDRSFSSIGSMSIGFGNILHNLTKVVFCSQNIDHSKQFEQLNCKKLLIWDFCDEVIPDKASVKSNLIKRRQKQLKKSIYNNDEDNEKGQLNEEVNSIPQNQIDPYLDFESLTQSFSSTILKIGQLEVQKDHNHDDEMTNELELKFRTGQVIQSSVQNEDSKIKQLSILIGAIKRVDGGGLEIFKNISELMKIAEQNPTYFHHICESYILGLACYGSYFPLRPIIHDHQRIKQATIDKIEKSINEISKQFFIDEIDEKISVSQEQTLEGLAWNLCIIFRKLLLLLKDNYSQEFFVKFGSLLPTNNGHNSNLSPHQFFVLNEYIFHSLSIKKQVVECENIFE